MRYDLTSLEIFVTVADTGNLTRAAEQQHLAVSAISKRITELEVLVGTSLLVRHARGVNLTPAGSSLVLYARQVLQLVERMRGELSQYAGGLKGIVRLHASSSALVEFLPPELQSFLERYPQIRLQIEERTGTAIVRAVADGVADLGILGNQLSLQGLESVPYRTDRLALAVPNTHALARRGSASFAEALEHPMVCPHADGSLWVLMEKSAQAVGKSLEPRIQVSSFECMCLLVGVGMGVALLPELIIAPHARQGSLKLVRLADEWAQREMVVIARDMEHLPLPVRALLDHLTAPPAPGA